MAFEEEVVTINYENRGGSGLKSESKVEAVLREVREETGIDTGKLEELYQLVQERQQAIYFGYLLKTEYAKDAIKLQEGETIDYKWLTKEEFIEFFDTNQATPTLTERLRNWVDTIREE